MSKLQDIQQILVSYKENINNVPKEELVAVLDEMVQYCGLLESQCINLLQIRDRNKLNSVVQRPFSWSSLRRDDSPFKAHSYPSSQ